MQDLLAPDELRTENLYREFTEDFERERAAHRERKREEERLAAAGGGDGDDGGAGPPADPKAAERERTAVLVRACFARERREVIFCGLLYGIYYGLQFMGPIFLKRILEGLSCRAYSRFPDTCTSKDTLFLYCFLICISPLVGGFCFTHHNYRYAAANPRRRPRRGGRAARADRLTDRPLRARRLAG